MLYVVAVLAAIAGAAGGWLGTGAAAAWVAGLFGMSDFEGERGMFAFFLVGPLGGLAGAILSAWAVVRVGKGRAALGPTLGRIALVLAGVAAVVGAAIGVRLLTLETYTNAAPPSLEFEIRMPAALVPPDPGALRIELHTDRNVGDSSLADPWVRADGDRRVIAGSVPLALKTSSRLLVVTLPGQPVRLFNLRLGRDPATTPAPGAWRRPDQVDDPATAQQPVAASPDDPVELRFRVRRAGDD